MTVNELSQYVKCDLEVKSGFNGKILCKKYGKTSGLCLC
jgi:hypothetical protein